VGRASHVRQHVGELVVLEDVEDARAERVKVRRQRPQVDGARVGFQRVGDVRGERDRQVERHGRCVGCVLAANVLDAGGFQEAGTDLMTSISASQSGSSSLVPCLTWTGERMGDGGGAYAVAGVALEVADARHLHLERARDLLEGISEPQAEWGAYLRIGQDGVDVVV
jgi:hypothetical protein